MAGAPLLNVGFSNFVLTDKVVAVVSSESAPMRRLIQQARNSDRLVDATQGRRTKSVIFTSSSLIVLSAVSHETLARRLAAGDVAADGE